MFRVGSPPPPPGWSSQSSRPPPAAPRLIKWYPKTSTFQFVAEEQIRWGSRIFHESTRTQAIVNWNGREGENISKYVLCNWSWSGLLAWPVSTITMGIKKSDEQSGNDCTIVSRGLFTQLTTGTCLILTALALEGTLERRGCGIWAVFDRSRRTKIKIWRHIEAATTTKQQIEFSKYDYSRLRWYPAQPPSPG